MPKRKAPEPVEPEPAAEPEEPAAAQEPADAEATESEFLNRAARRAQGKGKTAAPHAQQKGHFPHGQGARQGPRMWGNRRSG